jgi:nucleoside-diphosphate-sugar epimerase
LDQKVIIITGAAGFIGSSLTVELSRDHQVTALDLREPTHALRSSAPGVKWEKFNIADAVKVDSTFKKVKENFGRIDLVIHLAAYYHFGDDWRSEYERTNLTGTENLIHAALNTGVQRIIFSSSIAALEPPQPGHLLHEESPASNYIPYARSKSIGEDMFRKASREIPCTILRLGGVFSDWCELPPLYSLIRLWSSYGPLSRIIPGKGESGFPYIHLKDVIKIIKCCTNLSPEMEPYEIFMASPNGAVSHKDIFQIVRQSLDHSRSVTPVFTPREFIATGMYIKKVLAFLRNKKAYEQPWMLRFIDRPWIVDTTLTQKKLKWKCSPDLDILKRLPVIIEHYRLQRKSWIRRNILRNAGKYAYIKDIQYHNTN